MKILDHEVTWKKALVWLIIGLLGATIFNAFWDYLAKPGIGKFTLLFVNIVSSVFNSVGDWAYRISIPGTDGPSDNSIILILITGSTCILVRIGLNYYRDILESMLEMHEDIEKYKKERNTSNNNYLNYLEWTIYSIVICTIILNGIQSPFKTYANYLTRNFSAKLLSIAEFIPEDKEDNLRYRFYSMKGEADYDALMAEMKAIADKNRNTTKVTPEISNEGSPDSSASLRP